MPSARGPESVARRTIALDAVTAFDRLTALANHERLIPFTRVEVPNRRPQVGDVAVATSLGWLTDTMELVRYQAPVGAAVGYATWIKTGPILLGEAEITVARCSDDACHVQWRERAVRLRHVPASAWVVTAAIGVMTASALRRFDRLVRLSM